MITWNSAWGDDGDLGTHKGFISTPIILPSTYGLRIGDVASFVYATDGKPRLVFVIHPNFEGKCHALTLKYLDRHTLLRDILPHIEDGMTDPKVFYERVFKPSRMYDKPYRTYLVEKMSNITGFVYSVPRPGSEDEKQESRAEVSK